jgi:FkbM family methyltransferase
MSEEARAHRSVSQRIRDFAGYSAHEKAIAIGLRWRKWLPWIPYPFRLPSGSWWLVKNSRMDDMLFLHGGFWEVAQIRFVERFLRPGMTVMDIGAHHGLYTLLASKLVGRGGRVISFEPSPRERKRLRQHVRLNLCSNTKVEPYAVGETPGQAEFFVVDDVKEDWCNSLRPPVVDGKPTHAVKVEVLPLDMYLQSGSVGEIDLIKMDVEGAELSALKGAQGLLRSSSKRPVFMMEVEDTRTGPWGYEAREIVCALDKEGFEWFEPLKDGSLVGIGSERNKFEANLVAVPKERKEAVFSLLGGRC